MREGWPGIVVGSELWGHMREGTELVKYYSDSLFFIKEKCLQTQSIMNQNKS